MGDGTSITLKPFNPDDMGRAQSEVTDPSTTTDTAAKWYTSSNDLCDVIGDVANKEFSDLRSQLDQGSDDLNRTVTALKDDGDDGITFETFQKVFSPEPDDSIEENLDQIGIDIPQPVVADTSQPVVLELEPGGPEPGKVGTDTSQGVIFNKLDYENLAIQDNGEPLQAQLIEVMKKLKELAETNKHGEVIFTIESNLAKEGDDFQLETFSSPTDPSLSRYKMKCDFIIKARIGGEGSPVEIKLGRTIYTGQNDPHKALALANEYQSFVSELALCKMDPTRKSEKIKNFQSLTPADKDEVIKTGYFAFNCIQDKNGKFTGISAAYSHAKNAPRLEIGYKKESIVTDADGNILDEKASKKVEKFNPDRIVHNTELDWIQNAKFKVTKGAGVEEPPSPYARLEMEKMTKNPEEAKIYIKQRQEKIDVLKQELKRATNKFETDGQDSAGLQSFDKNAQIAGVGIAGLSPEDLDASTAGDYYKAKSKYDTELFRTLDLLCQNYPSGAPGTTLKDVLEPLRDLMKLRIELIQGAGPQDVDFKGTPLAGSKDIIDASTPQLLNAIDREISKRAKSGDDSTDETKNILKQIRTEPDQYFKSLGGTGSATIQTLAKSRSNLREAREKFVGERDKLSGEQQSFIREVSRTQARLLELGSLKKELEEMQKSVPAVGEGFLKETWAGTRGFLGELKSMRKDVDEAIDEHTQFLNKYKDRVRGKLAIESVGNAPL